jgi:hypothetical protein
MLLHVLALCELRIEFGSELREIGDSAFHVSRPKSVIIPSSVEIMGKYCFANCKVLNEIRFESESQLKASGESGFHVNRPKSVIVPSSVEIIGG